MGVIKHVDPELLIRDYQAGMSTTDVGARHGCTAGTVAYHLHKAGVELRAGGTRTKPLLQVAAAAVASTKKPAKEPGSARHAANHRTKGKTIDHSNWMLRNGYAAILEILEQKKAKIEAAIMAIEALN